jgi:glycine/D-amino acid oxidase-like deaminating enzyme
VVVATDALLATRVPSALVSRSEQLITCMGHGGGPGDTGGPSGATESGDTPGASHRAGHGLPWVVLHPADSAQGVITCIPSPQPTPHGSTRLTVHWEPGDLPPSEADVEHIIESVRSVFGDLTVEPALQEYRTTVAADRGLILGWIDPAERVLAIGGTGSLRHMLAPALGLAAAQLITGGATELEIGTMRPDRFHA